MKDPRSRQVGGDHYLNMGVQPWDALRAALTEEAWQGYLHGNAINYLMRADHKGHKLEDLEKAMHYLEQLIHELSAN
jgi:hypothetical protein